MNRWSLTGIARYALLAFLIGFFPLLALASPPAPPPVRAQSSPPSRRVNAPYFNGEIRFDEMAIFWFGQVNRTDNYVDVRVGYTDEELRLRLAIFDRRLWYDLSPSQDSLTDWDAITLYLDLDGNRGSSPDASTYRFVAQFAPQWVPRSGYQAAYRGNGTGWTATAVDFTTESVYRGAGGPNKDADNRGWVLTFHIPFASLGLTGPPASGTAWGLALELHDRDDAVGTPIAPKRWPETMDSARPSTWGQLAFGLPAYQPPPAVAEGSVTIRHKLDGATVVDAAVGGGTLCGSGLDFWSEWGEANYAGATDFNIQNQSDVADWPCFSKYYVTFPLDALPSGKVVLSATLTLHQFGGSDPSQAEPSYIQVFTVGEAWDETTLTWNNAPLAVENVSAAWVDPTAFPGWPGLPRQWDVTGAVAQAYAEGRPLRLVLYSADGPYHSGKYFVSSDTGDWNAEGRPTLTVVYGTTAGTLEKLVQPPDPSAGGTLTYTLVVRGTGRPMLLTDPLPKEVTSPSRLEATEGTVTYDAGSHRVTWQGTPAAGQVVTVTLAVTAKVFDTTVLVNEATLSEDGQLSSSDAAIAIVEPHRFYLPLIYGR